MVVFGQNGCIRGKGCILARMVFFGQKMLYSGKVVVFWQIGCIRAKVVVFGQTWLYSRKSGCIRAKVVVFEQGGCVRVKVVVIGQSG